MNSHFEGEKYDIKDEVDPLTVIEIKTEPKDIECIIKAEKEECDIFSVGELEHIDIKPDPHFVTSFKSVSEVEDTKESLNNLLQDYQNQQKNTEGKETNVSSLACETSETDIENEKYLMNECDRLGNTCSYNCNLVENGKSKPGIGNKDDITFKCTSTLNKTRTLQSVMVSDIRKRIDIDKKLEVIAELNNGGRARRIAKQYNISLSAVYNIKNESEKIKAYAEELKNTNGNAKKRRSMKSPANKHLDKAVYEWFKQQQSQGIPVSGQILCEKATEINRTLGGDVSFKGSNGWLRNFKARHDIHKHSIQC